MKKLFLDDVRNPPDSTWDVVRSYARFVAYIETHGVPDVISFDHDLSIEHYNEYARVTGNPEVHGGFEYGNCKDKTGWHCARWLVEKKLCPKLAVVHSMNRPGAENIAAVLEQGFRGECQVVIRVFDPRNPIKLVIP